MSVIVGLELKTTNFANIRTSLMTFILHHCLIFGVHLSTKMYPKMGNSFITDLLQQLEEAWTRSFSYKLIMFKYPFRLATSCLEQAAQGL